MDTSYCLDINSENITICVSSQNGGDTSISNGILLNYITLLVFHKFQQFVTTTPTCHKFVSRPHFSCWIIIESTWLMSCVQCSYSAAALRFTSLVSECCFFPLGLEIKSCCHQTREDDVLVDGWGRMAVPNRMHLWKSSKGEGVIFNPKIYISDFGNFKQG